MTDPIIRRLLETKRSKLKESLDDTTEDRDDFIDLLLDQVSSLQEVYQATPYRDAGYYGDDGFEVRLVDGRVYTVTINLKSY